MDKIGMRLRRLREHHGLSQRAMGARTGTNHSTFRSSNKMAQALPAELGLRATDFDRSFHFGPA